MLLIDADMLCVRPLDEIVERVRLGSIVAVEDIGRPGYSDAIWQQWQNRLQLGKLEPGVYANGGFFALPKELGTAFFTTFAQCLDRVDPSETHIDADGLDVELPFFWLDQDVANAVLASSPFREHTVILPYHCAPHAPFRGMKVAGNFSCVDDKGNRPVFLHHALQKPWLEPLPSNPYTELLVAYIHHPAAPAFDDRELPLFLRSGRAAALRSDDPSRTRTGEGTRARKARVAAVPCKERKANDATRGVEPSGVIARAIRIDLEPRRLSAAT